MKSHAVESILNSRLSYDYLDWPEHWMDVRPLTSGRALALLNPGEGEVSYYRHLGWDVRVFVFSQGLLLMWHEMGVQVNWLSSRNFQNGDWSLLSEMDCVVMNHSLGLFEEPGQFIDHVLALLPDEKPFYLQIENQRYYQNLINMASRENPPCRNYYVRTGDFQREEILIYLSQLENLKSYTYEDYRDQRYFDEGRDKYKTVTGPDCFLRLPFDDKREDYFVRTFRLKILGIQDVLAAMPRLFSSQIHAVREQQDSQTKVISALNTESQSNINPITQVEEMINQGDLSGAITLFKSIELSPGEIPSDVIVNMKGLLAFYQDQHEAAYFHFIDAIELNTRQPDYFLNLLDAAKPLDRTTEVRDLYRMSSQHFPELSAISHDMLNEGLC